MYWLCNSCVPRAVLCDPYSMYGLTKYKDFGHTRRVSLIVLEPEIYFTVYRY